MQICLKMGKWKTMTTTAPSHFSGWIRAVHIIVGVLSVVISFVTLIRPRLDIEMLLLMIPIVLLMNGISWIIHGATGR
jgi:uncharacterized membrane protein HdeD (DUF308 family)